MRDIDSIIVHCSATPPHMNIGAAEINEWHKARGWSGIGYHFVIRRDGTVEEGRPVERIGAHADGHNSTSIGVCLVGGVKGGNVSEANFTFRQYYALAELLDKLTATYKDADIIGHRDIPGVTKDCPCFNVVEFARKF